MPSDRGRAVAGVVLWGGIAILAVVITAAIIQTLSLVTTVREAQQNNTKTVESAKIAAREAQRGTDRIEECTTPGRPCYDQGQKRTADVVSDLNRVAVFAAACADKAGVQGEDEIFSCVIRLLAKNAEKP